MQKIKIQNIFCLQTEYIKYIKKKKVEKNLSIWKKK